MPDEQNPVKERSYRCPFTSEPIKIDGLLDEFAWKKAKPLSFIVSVTFENAEQPGRRG